MTSTDYSAILYDIKEQKLKFNLNKTKKEKKSMNKALICGRLTAKPIVNTGSNELKIANFTVAVDRKRRGADGQSEADFLRITCFGKQAEFVEQYVEQGDLVSIVGRIQTGSYNDEKTGRKVYTTNIISETLELMRKHNKPSEGKDEQDAKRSSDSMMHANFMEMDDDDDALPFN